RAPPAIYTLSLHDALPICFLHSHPALDAAHGALWIEDLLVARRLPYQKFPGWREPHAGGEHFCSAPEDPHTIANIRRDLRVCGSQIDAYDEVNHRFPARRLAVPRNMATRAAASLH